MIKSSIMPCFTRLKVLDPSTISVLTRYVGINEIEFFIKTLVTYSFIPVP